MRIAYFNYLVTPDNPVGGSHLFLLRDLAARHQVTVFAVAFESPDHRIEWVKVPAPRRPLFLLFLVYQVMATLLFWLYCCRKRVRFDVVHAVEGNVLFADVQSAHFCHTMYLRRHWNWRENLSLLGVCRWLDHWLHSLVETKAYRRARLVVVPSPGIAEEIRTLVKGVEGKLVVVPNPFDTNGLMRPAGWDRRLEREKLGLGSNEQVFCFVALGHFVRKGLPELLKALRGLDGENVRLLVVGGERWAVRQLRKLAKREGVSDRVLFTGRVRDPRAFYWMSDALVSPSKYETFSKVCFEAAGAGLPVITTKVHGVRDAFEDGVSAIFVGPDAASILQGLRRFLAMTSEERSALAERGQAAVRQFTVERLLEEWRAVHLWLERSLGSMMAGAGAGRWRCQLVDRR